MTDREQKNAAKEFAEYWKGKGYEKGESQPFWLSFLRDILGVEHPEQLDLLNKFNCNIVQGFLQGKPMPLSNCEEYLAGNEKALITIYSN